MIVAPAVVGIANVTVSLMTGEAVPLEALELEVTMALPDGGIEPVSIQATLQPDGFWRADGFYLALPGTWTMTLTALVSDFDRRSLSGPIVVVEPDDAPAAPP